jgi:protocatechuate 3,4-dioxygenase beta subunit
VAGITVQGGNDQVAKVGNAYSEPLQAAVVDTAGCAVANVDVTFSAPSSGASGTFAGAVTSATVATSSSGVATAPTFTANEVSGSFSVVAQAGGFEVDFSLTNTTVGVANAVSALSGNAQSAGPGGRFPHPLVVSVTDSSGSPVPGATVTFAVTGGSSGATASFVGGGASASEQSNESGQATSPLLTAGATAGAFTVTASVSGVSSPATFTLTVGPGAPYSVQAGAGTSQSTEAGTDFAIPLAVTVTDSNGNDVAGAQVVFKAPAAGPSGVFAGAGHVVAVTTGPDGVATAPAFSANATTGGYVVTASVSGVSSPATFAMVNEPRDTANVPGPAGSYRLVTDTGRVLASGSAADLGSLPASKLRGSKVVGMAETPGGQGYWLVTAKGQVFAFGDARYYGSTGKLHLARPIVGMAATPDGKGYWLVASDGGIFNYGDARYYGSTGKLHLARPIVGMAAPAQGDGYWLVASDGGVFAFGKATYYGSGLGLSPKPVKAIVPTPGGGGYWVVSANGTVAGFGDAGAQGSPTLSAGTVVAGAA